MIKEELRKNDKTEDSMFNERMAYKNELRKIKIKEILNLGDKDQSLINYINADSIEFNLPEFCAFKTELSLFDSKLNVSSIEDFIKFTLSELNEDGNYLKMLLLMILTLSEDFNNLEIILELQLQNCNLFSKLIDLFLSQDIELRGFSYCILSNILLYYKYKNYELLNFDKDYSNNSNSRLQNLLILLYNIRWLYIIR